MTRKMTKASFPLVSSTLGTIMVSFAAVWLATSSLHAPMIADPDNVSAPTTNPHHSSYPLYRLSPIPAGADWTS
jgi:ABC-type uncharacterized transport system permease subunit